MNRAANNKSEAGRLITQVIFFYMIKMQEIMELKSYVGFPCLVFASAKPIGDEHAAQIADHLRPFFSAWESHGVPVQGMAAGIENRFLIVAHRPVEISGCSRDALLFRVREIGKEFGVDWVGGSRLFYRDPQGRVADTDRIGFKALARSGRITPATPVFNTSLTEVDAWLAGKFEIPAAASWHARLLDVVTTPV